MRPTIRISRHKRTEPAAAAAAKHEARVLRGYAKLMSDAGQHRLAESLMAGAWRAVKGN